MKNIFGDLAAALTIYSLRVKRHPLAARNVKGHSMDGSKELSNNDNKQELSCSFLKLMVAKSVVGPLQVRRPPILYSAILNSRRRPTSTLEDRQEDFGGREFEGVRVVCRIQDRGRKGHRQQNKQTDKQTNQRFLDLL